MQPDKMPDAAAARLHVVASLAVPQLTPPAEAGSYEPPREIPATRSLIQVARADRDAAAGGDGHAVYSLGLSLSETTIWNAVGGLDLDSHSVERVLLSGLSALAMTHVREAGVQIGDAVLVLGADPWSLLLLNWARLQGASPLVYVGRGPRALRELATAAGAHLCGSTPADLARAAKLTHRGQGFAIALDAIGSEQSMAQALSALGDRCRYVLAGIHPGQCVSLNAYPDLHRRDLEIIAPMYSSMDADFGNRFRFSLALAADGRLQLDGLLDPAFGWHVVADTARR